MSDNSEIYSSDQTQTDLLVSIYNLYLDEIETIKSNLISKSDSADTSEIKYPRKVKKANPIINLFQKIGFMKNSKKSELFLEKTRDNSNHSVLLREAIEGDLI